MLSVIIPILIISIIGYAFGRFLRSSFLKNKIESFINKSKK